ncbi:AMP-binding protein [Lysinibacillus xylanilyticus]|uniref:AMP-binding protein n=1 Tax=Lysinibacillus xylanilyticus TaxID=582475 RepID=UPI003CFC4A50
MNNLVEALASAAVDANRLGYYFDGTEGTYREIDDLSNQVANQLKSDGLIKGDHIAMLMNNGVGFISVLYGIWKIGGVVIPINPTYTKNEISFILQNAEVKAVVSIPELEPVLDAIKVEVNSIRKTYFTNDQLKALVKSNSSVFSDSVHLNTDDVAVILYTSGTTGKPKGALLSHGNLFYNAVDTSKALEINESDISLVALPMFHIFALTVCVGMPIVTKSKMVIMKQFSPKEFLDLTVNQKVTFFGGVPTMYNFIYHFIKENPTAFSTITHCASGGASLPVALIEAYQKDFGITIQEGYGLSESAGVVTLNPRKGKIKPGTIGYSIGNYETKIVNDLGEEVPVGVTGELICKGENVFLGYYKLEEETSATLRNGWLYTGDLAVRDEDGYISIVDRKKDLIIVGGYNVYPREVEEVLYKHHKVVEAGVIGEPNEEYGQKVVAFVVGKDGLTSEELLAHCKENLATYKLPRDVIFMNELPKTSSGKILRKNLGSKGAVK